MFLDPCRSTPCVCARGGGGAWKLIRRRRPNTDELGRPALFYKMVLAPPFSLNGPALEPFRVWRRRNRSRAKTTLWDHDRVAASTMQGNGEGLLHLRVVFCLLVVLLYSST